MTEPVSGKRIVILGLARQGTALARWAARQGARVTASDIRPADALTDAIASLDGLPVELALGGHPLSLLDGCDLLCLSGGVPPSIPIVREAVRRNIPLSNDSMLFLERTRGRTIGITGSSGKTTTTTLVGKMLEASGLRTWVGGNIGKPLIEYLDEIETGDRVVLELSSFQLELFHLSPQVAAVLNVTPNHLDRHPSMENYTAAKANIFRWQGTDDVALLNLDDRITGEWYRAGEVFVPEGKGQPEVRFPLRAKVYGFSLRKPPAEGAYLKGDRLTLRIGGVEKEICRQHELKLRGEHNVANVLAASALARIAGADIYGIREAATTFAGVPHRLEEVRVWEDVTWVNDSIATTPERAVAALKSFDEPIVLLSGGRDKHLPWEEYSRMVHRKVRHLVLFGEAANLIEESVRKDTPADSVLQSIEKHGTLAEAVEAAARLARPGDVVLMSPGGTSFDAYEDFAERGEHFRQIVQALHTNRQAGRKANQRDRNWGQG